MKHFYILLLVLLASSCTGMLWDRESYYEEINSFYIEGKSNSFVALGKNFHYIFKDEKDLIKILRTSKSIKYRPVFYPFSLDVNNNISGKITLYVHKNDVTDQDVVFLKSMGFDDSDSYNNEVLTHDFSIKGVRYKLKNDIKISQNIGKTFKIKVLEPRTETSAELVAKALVTPVTIAADAVLVVFGGVLYGVAFAING